MQAASWAPPNGLGSTPKQLDTPALPKSSTNDRLRPRLCENSNIAGKINALLDWF